MTNWVSQQDEMITWGAICLSQRMVSALRDFLAAPRKAQRDTLWHAQCMAGQQAAAFFKGTRDSEVFRLTASKIVADAYEELRDQKAVAVIKPALVVKLRGQAAAIRAHLPAAQYLPGDANTTEFRNGLDSLCHWTTPVSAPTNKSGNLCARAFTLTLARKFSIAFVDIPVEFIHVLVLLGWPDRSLSATWKLLNRSVTDAIKREAERTRAQDASARSAAVRAIQAISTRRPMVSEAAELEMEHLQDQLERMRQGKPRFASDAARLRALHQIAQTLDDTALARELSITIGGELADFSHDPH